MCSLHNQVCLHKTFAMRNKDFCSELNFSHVVRGFRRIAQFECSFDWILEGSHIFFKRKNRVVITYSRHMKYSLFAFIFWSVSVTEKDNC
jgi:hypothetical protein